MDVFDQAPARSGRSERAAFIYGMAVSAVLHALIGWLLLATEARWPASPDPVEPRLIVFHDPVRDPPPAVRIPAPSTPVLRPAPPLALAAPPDIPSAPPGPPQYIAHDVPPRLLNGSAVVQALAAGMPEDLPEAASRRFVLLWLFVDPGGSVTRLRLQASSGYATLDRLARQVAPSMEYSPALHRGRRVGVWVAQRIRFLQPGDSTEP